MNILCRLGIHTRKRLPRTSFLIKGITFVGSRRYTIVERECKRCGDVKEEVTNTEFYSTSSPRPCSWYHPSNKEADYGHAEGIHWTVNECAEKWSYEQMKEYLEKKANHVSLSTQS